MKKWRMEITITKQTLELLHTYGISEERIGSALITLTAMAQNDDLTTFFTSKKSSIWALMSLKDLEYHGLIEVQEDPKSEHASIKLTDLGRMLTVEIGGATDDCSELICWVPEWVRLFPIRNREGNMLRTDAKSAVNKMRQFMKDYPYSKELIIEATKLYLKEQESKDHAYTVMAQHFISKQDSGPGLVKRSQLAAWCELLESGEVVQIDEIPEANKYYDLM